MIRAAIFLATFGYIGYFPIAPGTVGSAAGLLVYGAVAMTASPVVELTAILVLGILGIWAGTAAERFFGGIDPGPVVIDEVVGMLITLAFMPIGWHSALAGFFIFRLLDVIKPFPAGRFERLPGGLGVMLDDTMAAIYGNLLLRAILWAGWL
jgi:phosphatidylglycerophosphatase A